MKKTFFICCLLFSYAYAGKLPVNVQPPINAYLVDILADVEDDNTPNHLIASTEASIEHVKAMLALERGIKQLTPWRKLEGSNGYLAYIWVGGRKGIVSVYKEERVFLHIQFK